MLRPEIQLLEERRNKKLLIEEQQDEIEIVSSSAECKVQLHKLQMQYTELKNLLREDQNKLYLFEAYDQSSADTSDNHKEVAEVIDEDEIKEKVGSLRTVKEELDDVHNSFEILTDKMECDYNELLQETNILDESIKNYEIKNQKVLDMYEFSVAMTPVFEPEDNKEAAFALAQMKETQQRIREDISSDVVEKDVSSVSRFGDMGREYDIAVSSLKQAKDIQAMADWCNKYVELIRTLARVEHLGIMDGAWTVGIHGNSQDAGDSGLILKVAMKFTLNRFGQLKLASVETSCCDLDSSDIIKKAESTNDVRLLLSNLKDLWNQHYPFLNEMHTLRQKYALDWVEENRSLYVMYAKQSNVICRLSVNSAYPSNRQVTLESVKSDHDLDLTKLKPSKEEATLTEWLDYLHDKLVHGQAAATNGC